MSPPAPEGPHPWAAASHPILPRPQGSPDPGSCPLSKVAIPGLLAPKGPLPRHLSLPYFPCSPRVPLPGDPTCSLSPSPQGSRSLGTQTSPSPLVSKGPPPLSLSSPISPSPQGIPSLVTQIPIPPAPEGPPPQALRPPSPSDSEGPLLWAPRPPSPLAPKSPSPQAPRAPSPTDLQGPLLGHPDLHLPWPPRVSPSLGSSEAVVRVGPCTLTRMSLDSLGLALEKDCPKQR